MKANIKGALAQLNKSYRCFEHNGKPMTKAQVKKVLEFGIKAGYTNTDELKDFEIDSLLNSPPLQY